jgi:hypothetical protein
MQVASRTANRYVQHEWQRQVEQRRAPDCACFAPIQARVRQQNRNATDEQDDEAEYLDPVRDTHEGRVPRCVNGARVPGATRTPSIEHFGDGDGA